MATATKTTKTSKITTKAVTIATIPAGYAIRFSDGHAAVIGKSLR